MYHDHIDISDVQKNEWLFGVLKLFKSSSSLKLFRPFVAHNLIQPATYYRVVDKKM